MIQRWVVNASPLISLHRAGHGHILTELCSELVVPFEVRDEILAGPIGDPARSWLEGDGSPFVAPSRRFDARVLAWNLGSGESAVLSLALQMDGFGVILDDGPARNAAKTLGLNLRGTLGFIVLAKKKGILPGVRPVLNDLERAGMRIDAKLVDRVLELSDEV